MPGAGFGIRGNVKPRPHQLIVSSMHLRPFFSVDYRCGQQCAAPFP
jgi:hypothetical protein